MRRILQALCICIVNYACYAADLQSLLLKEQAGKVSVLLAINGTYNYKAFFLPNPNRVVVDLKLTSTKVNLQKMLPGNTMISNVRSGRPNPTDLRIVFDLKSTVSIHPITNDQGLTLEFLRKQSSVKETSSSRVIQNPKPSQVSTTAPIRSATPLVTAREVSVHAPLVPKIQVVALPTDKNIKPIHVSHSPARTMRDVIIVLDPGHGGKDPGAIGPRRNVEKNVTLSIAQKLKQIIDAQPGMRAVLTRKGDYYVGLRERLNIARKQNADIFISIHADAFINQHSHGASVFALSQTGATSEAARWLAEKENFSELGGVNFSGLDDKLIRTVLLDLSQTATIGASLQMGTNVLKNLDRITNLHNDKVEQARFVVLKSPDIPSILIETGFITNPREERNLTSSAYQLQLTQAILNGLKHYFWEHPPQGTRIEAMSNGNYRP